MLSHRQITAQKVVIAFAAEQLFKQTVSALMQNGIHAR